MQTSVTRSICLSMLFPLWLCYSAAAADLFTVGDLSQLSVAQLEQQLVDIDNELPSLARFSLRDDVGAIGNRSAIHDSANASEWIQVEFGGEFSFDEIVLVPTLWRDTNDGFRADGFPSEFRVIAGSSNDESGTVVAAYTEADRLLPRLGPVIVSCPGTTAAWVRIEGSRLTPRGFDGKFIMQLSEIFIFSGQENIALHKSVKTSSRSWATGGARDDRFLVDGYVPYLMDAGHGKQSLPFISRTPPDEQAVLTVDLLKSQPINRIHLHSIDTSDTAPRSTPADYGIPRHLIVEGGNRADFGDSVTLCEIRVQSIFDVSPVMTRQFKKKECRYVRFKAVEPYVLEREVSDMPKLGFAEIEIFSAGRNIALGKLVKDSHGFLTASRSIESLTDGRNLYGNILPIRDWLNELARRHDLEVARPKIAAELSVRYASQKSLLRRMTWLVAMLIVGIVLMFARNRRVRNQEIAAIRRRFAADLHDELGANLHTISLLTDLAQESTPSSEEYSSLLARIRSMTTRSGGVIRYWADVQQTKDFCTDLVSDMRRAAERIVVQLDHEFQIEGADSLDRLNSRIRVDILFFYKECLVNICRHSEATHLLTEMKVSAKEVRLVVIDNGKGLPDPGGDEIPGSLRRRARLLGASIAVERPSGGGTGIVLRLPIRKRRHC